jgi:hypothetical protein
VERQVWLSEQQTAAWLLILGGLVFTVGGILYTGRAILKWPAADTAGYLIWERGFVMGSVIVNVLGLVLLESLLRSAGDGVVARLGMITYVFGAAVLMVAETSLISRHEWVYSQVVLYVVLAFLSQAAFGAALLLTGFLPGWVGWATIAWNLAWLVALLVVSPANIYFPALHYAAPLLIGIMLLQRQ